MNYTNIKYNIATQMKKDSFSARLTQKIQAKQTPVLVGLDPRFELIPDSLKKSVDTQNPFAVATLFERFCKAIIDIISPLVPGVKPQCAFFEQLGVPGMQCLSNIIEYARQNDLLVILDGKRNDIGSTASAYANAYLGSNSIWKADALTVSPYLGDDSLSPFVQLAEERQAGIFVLVKTSNAGGAMFQDLVSNNKPIYQYVAEYVERLSEESCSLNQLTYYGNVGAVVGATWSTQLSELRSIMKKVWFLVPGYGSQGGTAADVAGAFDENGLGAIVNNSRGILFAHRSARYSDLFGENQWEKAVETATRQMIESLAAETSAGKLKT